MRRVSASSIDDRLKKMIEAQICPGRGNRHYYNRMHIVERKLQLFGLSDNLECITMAFIS